MTETDARIIAEGVLQAAHFSQEEAEEVAGTLSLNQCETLRYIHDGFAHSIQALIREWHKRGDA